MGNGSRALAAGSHPGCLRTVGLRHSASAEFYGRTELAPKRYEYRCDLAYVLNEIGDRLVAVRQFDEAFEIRADWPREMTVIPITG